MAGEHAVAAAPGFQRLSRVLAAAAAGGARVIEGRYTSDDACFVTEVVETDAGHLQLTITALGELAPGQLASCRWAFVNADGVSEVQRLVTPLSARPGRAACARYDLGSVLPAEAVDVAPAGLVPLASLSPGDVRAAFARVLYGSARRAWVALLERPDLPLPARSALLRELNRP
ncbi:MAG: hypothetical protein ACKVWR_19745 [Acidimicrobiales bacterium]